MSIFKFTQAKKKKEFDKNQTLSNIVYKNYCKDYSSSFLSFKETFLKKFFKVVPRD